MPAITITDLNNAKTDVDHIAAIATSPALTAIDRLGNAKDTMAGALYKIAGITDRGAWATATVYGTKDLVLESGTWYVCVVAHTSSAAFATDTATKWRVYQGVISEELSALTGSSLVGYGGRFGYLNRPVDNKLKESVSIQDEGALDDWDGATGTNCFNAFSRLLDLYPAGCTIRLPKTGTGIYNIVGDRYAGDVPGFMFDPDEGVSLRFVGTFLPMSQSAKFTRKLPIVSVNKGFSSYGTPGMFKPASDKSGFLTPFDGEKPVISSVNQTTAAHYSFSWPDGPATVAVPAVVTTDSISWNPVPSGYFNLSTISARAGVEVGCYFYAPGYAGSIMAGVLTDDGFSVVRQDVTGGSVLVGVKSGASAFVEYGVSTPVSSQLNYRYINGLVSIRVHSSRSYSVLVNGVELARVADAGGVILEAGFGAGFSNNAGSLTIAGMYSTTNVSGMGVQPIKVVVVGDSITAGLASWADFMRQYVSGVGGVQIVDLKNIAVSGDTSTGQNSALLATSVAGYNYGLLQIGVNDVQTGASVATFIANVTSMVNYLKSNGVVPIVGIPTIWYTQTESGGGGQASLNSETGSPYRSALIRYLAANNVAVNLMTLSDYGAIIPLLLTAANVDPVVMDNIHPSGYGMMVLGHAWARALIGEMMPKIDKSIINRPSPSSWFPSPYGASNRPAYSVHGDIATLSGTLSTGGGAIPNSTVLMTNPEILTPSSTVTIAAVTAGAGGTPNGYCILIINQNRTVVAYSVPVDTYYIYFGVSFPIL